ncbi:MAG: hypothetical protein CW338_03430 [Clostridiales bacterium]|nr:hypothetical protein [Clostridiales bacterium]
MLRMEWPELEALLLYAENVVSTSECEDDCPDYCKGEGCWAYDSQIDVCGAYTSPLEDCPTYCMQDKHICVFISPDEY